MTSIQPLSAGQLYRYCDPEALGFRTTEELEPLELPCGQQRALEALDFATGMRNDGFNLFVLGPAGVGKREWVQQFLAHKALAREQPRDWAYLYNFDAPDQPRALALPTGVGRRLKRDLEELMEELRSSIPATFESDEYQSRLQELQQAANRRHREAIEQIQREAEEEGIALLTTPSGFTFAPKKDGEVLSAEEFQKLPEEERDAIEKRVEQLQEKLQYSIQQLPQIQRELREQVRQLNEEMVLVAAGAPIGNLKDAYSHLEPVVAHLDAVRKDVIEHVEALQGDKHGRHSAMEAVMERYQLNLIVDNAEQQGAPVVYEDLPLHQHLVGRIEHYVHQGALMTDFTLIRAGALHRANGGYLVLDALRVLQQPMAWESLKRALSAHTVRIQSLERLYGLASTVSLEPEPIPLDVKVALVGDRFLYYLLAAYDPDFLDLFKVQADFEDEVPRTDESQRAYARMLATMARRDALRPLTAPAVGRIIEQAGRLSDDQEKLTAQARMLRDLLMEADYWAGRDEAAQIEAAHVERTIGQQRYRGGRIRERTLEFIERGTVMIDTTGEAVAQVNGLSVLHLGDQAFGRPTRITATARAGRGQVLDIEREAKLGGNIHSKGVMILSRYLATRYAREGVLSLSASLAFEQSYGGVEGDSASVAELCALVSAIAGVPLQQSLAVTGSVNQHGEVQAVGGVNEKIEGFFEVCEARGGVDGQGVLLPATNVPHLMLHRPVREAVAAGRFHVYPIRHVDEALELITGMSVGAPDEDGVYPEGSLNRLVADRLAAFAESVQRHSGKDNGNEGDSGSAKHREGNGNGGGRDD